MKPVLIVGYGNPSRGDDALGPEFLVYLEASAEWPKIEERVETLTDFQLQVEHVLDMKGRELVLFVDASVSAIPPYEFTRLQPRMDDSYTSHAMSPHALLIAYKQYHGAMPPPCYLLTIRGHEFGLGSPLSDLSKQYANEALAFVVERLKTDDFSRYNKLETS